MGKSCGSNFSGFLWTLRGDSDATYWHVSEAALQCFLKRTFQVEKHVDIRPLGLYLNRD